MSEKTVTLTIDRKSGVGTLQAGGFQGTTCETATEQFRNALGVGQEETEKLPEYYEREVEHETLRQGH